MRVTAGRLKGRKLCCPRGLLVRPASDLVRETVFDILADRIPGASVLDLFAGVGTLGIEALSRGARRVVFVEKSERAWPFLMRNLTELAGEADWKVYKGDAIVRSRVLSKRGERYDVVFADPPYCEGLAVKFMRTEAAYPVCAVGGVVVVRHHRREPVTEALAGADGGTRGRLVLAKEKRLGDTVITILERRTVQPQRAEGIREGP